jgi:hypothetical protein
MDGVEQVVIDFCPHVVQSPPVWLPGGVGHGESGGCLGECISCLVAVEVDVSGCPLDVNGGVVECLEVQPEVSVEGFGAIFDGCVKGAPSIGDCEVVCGNEKGGVEGVDGVVVFDGTHCGMQFSSATKV